MKKIELITSFLLLMFACVSFIISYLQFKEKGPLLNNAYLYASKEQRMTMNKKPHYRQSAIVFWGIGVLFILLILQMLLDASWVYFVIMTWMILLVVYAIVSAVLIAKNERS